MENEGLVKGYSYWIFSDIFEENYFSSDPFHGGFGLLNIYGIPKPAYRAYELLHRLGEEKLPVGGHHPTVDCWMTRKDKTITVLLANFALPKHTVSTEAVDIKIDGISSIKKATLERVDEKHANATTAWREMGRPKSLTHDLVKTLEDASRLVQAPLEVQVQNQSATFMIPLPPQGTALITLEIE
jgi:xylan 1,4-beta-xylosidase